MSDKNEKLNNVLLETFNISYDSFMQMCNSNDLNTLFNAFNMYMIIYSKYSNFSFDDFKMYIRKSLIKSIDSYDEIKDRDYSFSNLDNYIINYFNISDFNLLNNREKNVLRTLIVSNFDSELSDFIEDNYNICKRYLDNSVNNSLYDFSYFLDNIIYNNYKFKDDSINSYYLELYIDVIIKDEDFNDDDKISLLNKLLISLNDSYNFINYLNIVYNKFPKYFGNNNYSLDYIMYKFISYVGSMDSDDISKKQLIDKYCSSYFRNIIIPDNYINPLFYDVNYVVDLNTPKSILLSKKFYNRYRNKLISDLSFSNYDDSLLENVNFFIDSILSNVSDDDNSDIFIDYICDLVSYSDFSVAFFDKIKKRDVPKKLYLSYSYKSSYLSYLKNEYDNHKITHDEKNHLICKFLNDISELTPDEISFIDTNLKYDTSNLYNQDEFLNEKFNYNFIKSHDELIKILNNDYNKKFYYTFFTVVKEKNVDLNELDIPDKEKIIIKIFINSFNFDFYNNIFNDDNFIPDEKFIKSKIYDYIIECFKSGGDLWDIMYDYNYLDLSESEKNKFEYLLSVGNEEYRTSIFNSLYSDNKEMSEFEVFKKVSNCYLDDSNYGGLSRLFDKNYFYDKNKFYKIFSEINSRSYISGALLENVDFYLDESGFKDVVCSSLFETKNLKVISFIVSNLNEEEKEKFLSSLDDKQRYIFESYSELKSNDLKTFFIDYLFRKNDNSIYYESLSEDKLTLVKDILYRLENSNSSELRRLKHNIADAVLNCDKSLEVLNYLENVFLYNSIPRYMKLFITYKKLYPNLETSRAKLSFYSSPVLLDCIKEDGSYDIQKIDSIILSDLAKASINSNSRSLRDFTKTLSIGIDISNNNLKSDNTDKYDEYFIFLKEYFKIYYDSDLNILDMYDYDGNFDKDILLQNIVNTINLSKKLGIVKSDKEYSINYLSNNLSFSVNDLKVFEIITDKIVSKSFSCVGINKLSQLIDYMNENVSKVNIRNKCVCDSRKKLVLEDGDLVKGIGDNTDMFYNYILPNILSNGFLCKEFLGDDASSDKTPLDTDLTIYDHNDTGSRQSDYFGNVMVIIKNKDSKMNITRRSNVFIDKNKNIGSVSDSNSLEAFNTYYSNQYGIRTGFPISEVDAFMVRGSYDNRLGLEIAKSGVYIPVVDENGNYLFTWDDFERYRNEMNGLSYYDMGNSYNISDNLNIDDSMMNTLLEIDKSINDSNMIRNEIERIVKDVLSEYGIEMKNYIDGNLKSGVAEFLDTGSTSRGTCVYGDADFDFMFRFDRYIFSNEKYKEINAEILKRLNVSEQADYSNLCNIRKAKAHLNINGRNVDALIDITSTYKKDKIEYSTDMCIRDRLDTIKKLYPDKYKSVLANIIFAKNILKEHEVYKKKKNDKGEFENGLGGVGVENWILQNGGSFYDAVCSFIDCAENTKSLDGKYNFNKFKNIYRIIDFGQNHNAGDKKSGEGYFHDNFIYNLSEESFNKMLKICINYKKQFNNKIQSSIGNITLTA